MFDLKRIGLPFLALAACLGAQEPATKPDQPKQPAQKTRPQIAPEIAKLMGMPTPEDPAAVERGSAIFVTNCAFCHGTSGTGGEGGPDLVRSTLVLHDEKGDKIGPVIVNGRKTMPKFPFSQTQIADISSFLHNQSQKVANRMGYEIHNVITGDPKAGEAYFKNNCQSCHSPTGDLAGVATRFDPVALQSRFLYPRTHTYPGMPVMGPKPKPTTVTVTLASGQTFSGTLKHLDDFSVSLYDADGEYHSWLREKNPGMKIEVHDPLQGHAALLPKYTDSEMHNVLAYLETLK